MSSHAVMTKLDWIAAACAANWRSAAPMAHPRPRRRRRRLTEREYYRMCEERRRRCLCSGTYCL